MMKAEPLTEEMLQAIPVFPLPRTLLMPRTFISLQIFEPRYRTMMRHCLDSHRLMAVVMTDESQQADQHGRPAIFPVAGLGKIRRSAKLPDGRYNIILEGIARAEVSQELPPSEPYRQANAQILPDFCPEGCQSDLEMSMASLRTLCAQAVMAITPSESEMINGIHEITDPGHLSDMIAAATLQDPIERQRVLTETNVLKRINIVAGALGTILLNSQVEPQSNSMSPSWGVQFGDA